MDSLRNMELFILSREQLPQMTHFAFINTETLRKQASLRKLSHRMVKVGVIFIAIGTENPAGPMAHLSTAAAGRVIALCPILCAGTGRPPP